MGAGRCHPGNLEMASRKGSGSWSDVRSGNEDSDSLPHEKSAEERSRSSRSFTTGSWPGHLPRTVRMIDSTFARSGAFGASFRKYSKNFAIRSSRPSS